MLIASYITVVVLLHIPAIQYVVGSELSQALQRKLGTRVMIGRIDWGLLNRVIIDDVAIYDQQNNKMLNASRISVKIDLMPLLHGTVSVASAQIFGLKAQIYKQDASSKANYQFVIDSLSSKKPNTKSSLNLNIKSLIIRNGALSYDILNAPPIHRKFDKNHLALTNISSHLMFYAFSNDSLHVNCKKLALHEQSGINIQSLTLDFKMGKNNGLLSHFRLKLPSSEIRLGDILFSFKRTGKDIDKQSLRVEGQIIKSKITLQDVAAFVPQLKQFSSPLYLESVFYANGDRISIPTFFLQAGNQSIILKMGTKISGIKHLKTAFIDIKKMSLKANAIDFLSKNINGKDIKIPTELLRMGDINYKGEVSILPHSLNIHGRFTTDAGNATLSINKWKQHVSADIDSDNLNLKKIFDNGRFGNVAASLSINGEFNKREPLYISAKGAIKHFFYNGYTYKNIDLDGTYENSNIKGKFSLNDPNAQILIKGSILNVKKRPDVDIELAVSKFSPVALNLSKSLPGNILSGNVKAQFSGLNLDDMVGNVEVTDFSLSDKSKKYQLDKLSVKATKEKEYRHLAVTSDFGNLDIIGKYDYKTIFKSITNHIANKIPTLPGLPKFAPTKGNNFRFDGNVTKTDWAQALFNIPIEIHSTLHLSGEISDIHKTMFLNCSVPDFSIKGNRYKNVFLSIISPKDSLKAYAKISKVDRLNKPFSFQLTASAINNHLNASISWNNNKRKEFSGTMNVGAEFFHSPSGIETAKLNIQPSTILINDTIWHLHSSNVLYSRNNLVINEFNIEHNNQHIIVNGHASRNENDSIKLDLKGIDVAYILDLVSFHSVEFSGIASGQAVVKSVFSNPKAVANLNVENFKFENGRMGILNAQIDWNKKDNQIDINSISKDGNGIATDINGYVSLAKKYMDLKIGARGTRTDFLNSFCSSFMENIDARAKGFLNVYGPLKAINMEGKLCVNGTTKITSLNTEYTLDNDTIVFQPNKIVFDKAVIHDRNQNTGIVNGMISHRNLKKFSYDINIDANNLLCYDLPSTPQSTMSGTVYANGNCHIVGKSGEVNIDINATPQANSIFTYNVGQDKDVEEHQFLKWQNASTTTQSIDTIDTKSKKDEEDDIPTDLHINFLINCLPEATLKLLVDNKSGDYIALKGNGVIRANYFNKGAFQMFGNYVLTEGIYKLTIQDIIKKEFHFQPGGTIAFRGDPFQAAINMKAFYTVNSVSLSDLEVGRSFSDNNIKVNCFMNITGTPAIPKIDFDLDMPTLSGEAKNMIRSLITSEEEMNQQVIYLLAVGRFYNSGNNNSYQEHSQQLSQTRLAMQSLLSGTVSQQINSLLSGIINSENWNFGANISTGDEGWNNAEYEGLLSGSLLNNRLLINGQFGYRDKANATTNFIGDFNIKYLLFPNGNLSINVYSQTNDRYFTRNSMNTQGIGLIMKKDFNGLRELFGLSRKKNKKQQKTKNGTK